MWGVGSSHFFISYPYYRLCFLLDRGNTLTNKPGVILTHLSILETVSDDGKVNYVHTYGKTPNAIVSALVKKSGISSWSFFYSTLQIVDFI